MIKRILLCLLMTVFLLFPGCTLTTGIDTLMSPPTLTKEQEDIYGALIASVGSNIKLRYPKAGSWLSAFVVYNLDDEPSDEAIVFYERTGIAAGEGTLRINILDRLDGEWRSVYDHSGTGADVERVMLSKLGDSDELNIIVGFSLVAENDKIINIYNYSDGILTLTYSDNYSNAQILDLDGSGQNRLLLVSGRGNIREPQVKSISLDSSGVFVKSAVALNETATELLAPVCGRLSDSTTGIYIDSVSADGMLHTELLYSSEGALTNAFFKPDSDNPLFVRTMRPAGFFSADIDGDGVVEIPVARPFEGYEESPDAEKVYLTTWLAYEDGMLYRKYNSYYSTYSDFCLLFPDSWDSTVTAAHSATGEVVFLDNISGEEILTIAAVTKSDIPVKEREGFTLIRSKSETGYLARQPEKKSELSLSIAEISVLMKIW